MTSCGVDPRKLPIGIPVLVKGRYPGVVLSTGKRQGWLGLKTPIHIKLDATGEHIVALPSQVRMRPCTYCQQKHTAVPSTWAQAQSGFVQIAIDSF